MTLQEQYDAAMFDFSQGEFTSSVAKLKQVLAQDPAYFDAQLALGMAYYRLGDFACRHCRRPQGGKIASEGTIGAYQSLAVLHEVGDKVTAEHHGLQARIAGWRAENAAAKPKRADPNRSDPELQMAKPKPPQVKVIRMPDQFPEQPWKKKKIDS